jgi:hypothetical protein
MDQDDQDRRKVGLRERARSLWSDHASVAGIVDRARAVADRVRDGGEDAAWFLRERLAWPVEDGLDELGPRGRIGVFGGGGIALAGVVVALVVATSGGSGSGGGTTEAFVANAPVTPSTAVAPAVKPKKKTAKPSGPTLHGAPPDFAPAKEVKAGVGGGKAVEKEQGTAGTGGAPAARGSGSGSTGENGTAGASADDAPASTAKIGSNPAATASAAAQADSLATGNGAGAAETGTGGGNESELTGPPAPKAAKQTARHFAEAFVVYETGGVDARVRKVFGATTTKQLSKSLLHRPPRQPASVKVPRAKVVNVVAGPSKGTVYSVSVSLLRVGVTSELRLELERGPGKKWQVTDVLG